MSLRIVSIPLDKETWDNIAPIILKSFNVYSTNITNVKKWADRQEEKGKRAEEAHSDLEARVEAQENSLHATQRSLEELVRVVKQRDETHREQAQELQDYLQRLVATTNGLQKRLLDAFSLGNSEVYGSSRDSEPATGPEQQQSRANDDDEDDATEPEPSDAERERSASSPRPSSAELAREDSDPNLKSGPARATIAIGALHQSPSHSTGQGHAHATASRLSPDASGGGGGGEAPGNNSSSNSSHHNNSSTSNSAGDSSVPPHSTMITSPKRASFQAPEQVSSRNTPPLQRKTSNASATSTSSTRARAKTQAVQSNRTTGKRLSGRADFGLLRLKTAPEATLREEESDSPVQTEVTTPSRLSIPDLTHLTEQDMGGSQRKFCSPQMQALLKQLEVTLHRVGGAVEGWILAQKAEHGQQESMQATIRALQSASERTFDRLLSWRVLLKESSVAIEGLGESMLGLQGAVQELKSSQVVQEDIHEAIDSKTRELLVRHDDTEKRLEGLSKGLDCHVGDVERMIKDTRKYIEDRVDESTTQSAKLLEKNLNPISAYLNRMHLKVDTARSELDHLNVVVPKLSEHIDEVDKRSKGLEAAQTAQGESLWKEVGSLTASLDDFKEKTEKETSSLAERISGLREHADSEVEILKISIAGTSKDVDTLRDGNVAAVSKNLTTLEQKVAKWVHALPLPAKVSEARLFSLEAKLAEETEARLNIERQVGLRILRQETQQQQQQLQQQGQQQDQQNQQSDQDRLANPYPQHASTLRSFDVALLPQLPVDFATGKPSGIDPFRQRYTARPGRHTARA